MLATDTPRQQIAAMVSLYQSPVWIEISKLLEAQIEDALHKMTESADPVALHRMQGRVKALRQFKDAVAQAPDIMRKMGV